VRRGTTLRPDIEKSGKDSRDREPEGRRGQDHDSVNLAAGLALAERPTLLVDLDPSGQRDDRARGPEGWASIRPSTTCSGRRGDGEGGQADRHTGTEAGFQRTSIWSGAEIELVGVERREHRLRDVLMAVSASYGLHRHRLPSIAGPADDQCPRRGDRGRRAVQCEFYALRGVAHLLKKTVKLVRAKLNPVSTSWDRPHDVRRPTSLALQIRRRGQPILSGACVRYRQFRATCASRKRQATVGRSCCTISGSSGSAAYLD